jgi:hypothetical protein
MPAIFPAGSTRHGERIFSVTANQVGEVVQGGARQRQAGDVSTRLGNAVRGQAWATTQDTSGR